MSNYRVPPFEVVSVHDGHKLTVIDIDEDPLDVGVRCVYFREGGWLMVSDLLKNFTISKPVDVPIASLRNRRGSWEPQ